MRQSNAFAMQYGVIYGFWGTLTLAAYVGAFAHPELSFVNLLMLCGAPIVAAVLTCRFRNEAYPGERFTFGQGFVHTLFLSLYASVWVALAVFIYMKWIDGGYIFDSLVSMLSMPEMEKAFNTREMQESLGGLTIKDFVNGLRALPPANFSAMSIYFQWIVAPFVATFAGFVAMRRQ